MKKRLLTILGAILATSLSAQVTHTQVGRTKYSLQSNGAVYNRIVKNADGTISVAWTYSNQDGEVWPDRGTGYNYFNGTSWINSATTTARVESKRTGFPSIVTTNSGVEVITAHDGTNGVMTISRRDTKGSGAWTQYDIPTDMLWNRTAVGGPTGETIHMISHDESNTAGLVYYLRSLDAGATWSDPIEIPGFTINEFPELFRGDEYAIAAKGNNVAVVFGGTVMGVYMAKSTDNGATWTTVPVSPFPIPNYVPTGAISDVDNDGVADTLNACDGAVNVMFDNSSIAHVTWGNLRILDEVVEDQYSYFPGSSDGIMYWNENLSAPKQIASMVDVNNDGLVSLSQYFVPDWGFGMYGSSLSSYPTASVDNNNFIYVAYSGLVEATEQLVDDDNNPGTPDIPLFTGPGFNGKLYRHIHVTYSGDGGLSWSKPFDTNINNPVDANMTEAVYPSLAGLIDNDLHILYQRDTIPGYGVTSTDDPFNADAIHDIVYVKVPKTSLPCNPFTISVNAVKDTCMNSVGVLNLTNVLGAVGTYTYEWGSVDGSNNFVSIGANTSMSGIMSGVYRVATNDSRNCKDTLEFNLGNYVTPINVSLTQTLQPATCSSTDGEVTSVVSNGRAPYNYSWSNSISTDGIASGLSIGAHILTVTDANTCVGTGSIILLPVTNTSSFTATVATTSTRCFGSSDGSAEVSVSPAGSYSYTWTPSGQTSTIATGLSAGNYEVYINDGTCGNIATFTIVQPSASVTATLTSTSVLCFGAANGSVTATANGGTPPYTFTWNTAAGGSIVFDNSSSTITGLASGSAYGVMVNDVNNCNVFTPANIAVSTPLALGINIDSKVNTSFPASLTTDGVFRVTVSGGTPPYSLSWTRTSTITGAGSGTGPSGFSTGQQEITGLKLGSHKIKVTDANGCQFEVTSSLVNTGIEDNTEIVKDLSVYPNPTTDNVTIDFNVATPSNVSVKLMGLNGQLVYTKELGQFAGKFSHSVDMSSEAKGVYFLQITTDKDVINKKVIKN